MQLLGFAPPHRTGGRKMSLTDQEIRFLARHGYGPESVYNGLGQGKAQWQAGAKAAGKDIVLATPCSKPERHRLKTRAGHCFQCRPLRIAFQRRESVHGYVYIAGSLKGRLIKIGMSQYDVWTRDYKNRYDSYGGFDDWHTVFHVHVEDAGRIERLARERLRAFRVSGAYVKDGNPQDANEMLRCTFSQAREALMAVIGEREHTVWRSVRRLSYEFDGDDDSQNLA